MKRLISLLLTVALLMSGCSQVQNTDSEESSISQMIQASSVDSNEDSIESTQETNEKVIQIDDPEADPTPYKYEVKFDDLDDGELKRYVEDNIYSGIVATLDSDKYFVENVSAIYISQEYIDELAYNSKANVFFGYTLAELDDAFKGTRYVFTLGDEGETIVTAFEDYDDTYEQVIRNVAIGTGVILVCVTVSVVTGGVGAPAISMIFATAAKTGTAMALSSGTISAIAAGVVTEIQTGDFEQAKKAAALAGSESFKWGAIIGSVAGGASEAIALKGATLNGLSMNEAAVIQKESKYPLEVIKQFHSMEEYEVFHAANLKAQMVNGELALVRADIDLNYVDEFGRTNLQRMMQGLSPLDANGASYELHHIGQKAKGTLAILTKAEHDSAVLHGFTDISEIDRVAFAPIRKKFWKEMANLFAEGVLL